MAMKVMPPSIVLWKLDLTESNKNFPNMLAMVGIRSAPHKTRVADTGCDRGGRSSSGRVNVGFTSILREYEGISFLTCST